VDAVVVAASSMNQIAKAIRPNLVGDMVWGGIGFAYTDKQHIANVRGFVASLLGCRSSHLVAMCHFEYLDREPADLGGEFAGHRSPNAFLTAAKVC
jgi:hypothetical protein